MIRLLVQNVALIGLLGLGVGCGDSEGSGSGGGNSGGSSSGATGGTASGGTGGAGNGGGSGGTGGEAECPDGPGFVSAPAVATLNGLNANLVTPEGAPVGNVPVQFCGFDICLFSDADGAGAVSFGAPPNNSMDNPALKVGDGLLTGRVAYFLPPGADPVVVDAVVPSMVNGGQPLTPGSAPSAGGVTVTIPAGATVEIDQLTYIDEADRTLRGGIVSGAAVDAIAPGEGFDLVVAVAPLETHVCPAAHVAVANDAGLAPGTSVDFLIHGTSIEEPYAGYRQWEVISTGMVSGDGSVIETADAEGLPYLDTFAIRAN